MKWLIELLRKFMKYIVEIISEIFHWCHTSISAPTLLTAIAVPPNIELQWIDNADNNTCFNIWRSSDGTNFTLIDTIADLENYSDSTAESGVNYWYKVQACNDDGDTSDFSNTVEIEGVGFTEIDYGLLYNWYAANGDGIHNIAPTGWHVPTEAEYNTLITYVGGNTVAGRELKSEGITYWSDDNGLNTYGFNWRGNGSRQGASGEFGSLSNVGTMWSSTSIAALFARGFHVTNISNASNDPSSAKYEGKGIRIIKDDSDDPGSVTDYDGNVYPTVKIDTQVWTTLNLRVTHYSDGTSIPEVTDNATWAALTTGALCAYNNDWGNV